MARAIHKKSDGGVQYTVRTCTTLLISGQNITLTSHMSYLRESSRLTGWDSKRAPVPCQRRLRRLGQVAGNQVGLPLGASGRGEARLSASRKIYQARGRGGVRGSQGRNSQDKLHPRLAKPLPGGATNYESPNRALTAMRNSVIRTVRTTYYILRQGSLEKNRSIKH